jgi:hypothetical protein
MKKSFSDKLKQITQKQLKEVDETICDISRDLFKTIVDKTPVGKSVFVNGGTDGSIYYLTNTLVMFPLILGLVKVNDGSITHVLVTKDSGVISLVQSKP